MKIILRPMLEVGYKAYNGHVFSKADCRAYNVVQEEINCWIVAGSKVPQEMFNRSAFMFNTITNNEGK